MENLSDFGRTSGSMMSVPGTRFSTAVGSALNEPLTFETFGAGLNTAIVGASGGIGGAFADLLHECPVVDTVIRLSRTNKAPFPAGTLWFPMDLEDEGSIADAAASIKQSVGSLHLVIVATGILHDRHALQPEKSWRSLNADALEMCFRVNTIGPALVAKHLLPLLSVDCKSVIAALSARVGSIGDNKLGGWYAYRASKVALNMIIRTLSIELARRNPKALCVGLHPGTVDTGLSRPFQRGVPDGKLFAPRQSARFLLDVLDGLSSEHSGQIFAWDGQPIAD